VADFLPGLQLAEGFTEMSWHRSSEGSLMPRALVGEGSTKAGDVLIHFTDCPSRLQPIYQARLNR